MWPLLSPDCDSSEEGEEGMPLVELRVVDGSLLMATEWQREGGLMGDKGEVMFWVET